MTVALVHPLACSSSTSLTSRSGSEAKIFHHEITSSPTSARSHASQPFGGPADFLSSRSRVARRLRPVDWTVKLRPETVARGLHARRRGRKDKWGRKKRAFFLGKYSRSFGWRANRLWAPFRENPFAAVTKQIAGHIRKLKDSESVEMLLNSSDGS